jgi:hypothetical protein
MNDEVMPVGTAARLAELEAEVERLRALNGALLEALRHPDTALALWPKQHETFYKDSRGDYSGMVRDRIAAIAKAEGQR